MFWWAKPFLSMDLKAKTPRGELSSAALQREEPQQRSGLGWLQAHPCSRATRAHASLGRKRRPPCPCRFFVVVRCLMLLFCFNMCQHVWWIVVVMFDEFDVSCLVLILFSHVRLCLFSFSQWRFVKDIEISSLLGCFFFVLLLLYEHVFEGLDSFGATVYEYCSDISVFFLAKNESVLFLGCFGSPPLRDL